MSKVKSVDLPARSGGPIPAHVVRNEDLPSQVHCEVFEDKNGNFRARVEFPVTVVPNPRIPNMYNLCSISRPSRDRTAYYSVQAYNKDGDPLCIQLEGVPGFQDKEGNPVPTPRLNCQLKLDFQAWDADAPIRRRQNSPEDSTETTERADIVKPANLSEEDLEKLAAKLRT